MAFPDNVLGNKVEIYYDGEWHDITAGNVRGLGAEDGEISITARGEPDETTTLVPTQATLSLNNRDGRFSPRNAASDLYGKIGLNTPLRIATDLTSTKSVSDTFGTPSASGWPVSDSGHVWTFSGGATSEFSVTGGEGVHSHDDNVALRAQLESLTITDFDCYLRGIHVEASPTGAAVEIGVRGRVVDISNFIEARIFYTTSNTVTQQLRQVVAGATAGTGETTLLGATSADTLDIRFQSTGATLRMKVWESADSEPDEWTHEITTTHLTPGYILVSSGPNASNSNAKPYDVFFGEVAFSLGVILFTGEVVEWPKKWDPTGRDVWVPVVATGITRRLRQGNRPIRSPLYTLYTKDLSVDHYWPMEDIAQQTRYIRNEIAGGSILSAATNDQHNKVQWSANDFLVGSGKLLTIESLPIPEGVFFVPESKIYAPDDPGVAGTFGEEFAVSDVSDANAFAFSCWFYYTPLTVDYPVVPATTIYFAFTLSTDPFIEIFVDLSYYTETQLLTVSLYSEDIGLSGDTGSVPFTDEPHFLLVSWSVNGANLWTVNVYIDNTLVASDSGTSVPFVHTQHFDFSLEPWGPITIGHIALETGSTTTTMVTSRETIYEAGQGYPGETAVDRFVRLCETEGVAYEVFTDDDLDVSYPTLMGPQRPGNFINHLDDISLADGGLIYELRTPFGYGFRTRASLYGVPSSGYPLVLDYANADLGEVPFVTDDDAKTRNIIRAKLRGGTQGELSHVVSDGPLGTDIVGPYEDGGLEVPLNTTEQLIDFVTWAGYLGTWDEDRWPELTVHLHRTPFTNDVSKFADALLLEVGQLLQVQNPPVWVGNGSDYVLQQMRAVAVKLSNFNLSLTYTLLPGGPYALGRFDETSADRMDIEDCHLVDAVDSDDTLLLVSTDLTQTPSDTPLWTLDPAEFDMWGHEGIELRINPASRSGGLGGERVTIGATHPVEDTFTRSGAQLAGTNADTGQTWASTLGTPTDTVLNGTAAVSTHTTDNTSCWHTIAVGDFDMTISATVTFNFTTATGAAFFVDILVRQVNTTNNYRVRLNIDAGSDIVFLNPFVTLGGSVTHLANMAVGSNVSGTPIHVKVSIYARTLLAKAWFDGTDEPDWMYTGYDAATHAINGTDAAIRSGRLTSNTNTNPSATWDNVRIHTPLIRPSFWDRFARTVLDDPNVSFPDDGSGLGYHAFYLNTGSADVDFTPNQLQITGSAANGYAAVYRGLLNYLNAVASVVWTAPLATGGNLEPCNIIMRGTSITSYVMFRAIVTTDQQIFGQIFDAASNFLGQFYVPPDAHTPTRAMKMKAACYEDQLMMKLWDPTMPEPETWGLVVTDPNPVSGWIGLRAGRAADNTNTNAAMVFYDFKIENPQKLTVVRGANGISRGWDAGSVVSLWEPIRLGR